MMVCSLGVCLLGLHFLVCVFPPFSASYWKNPPKGNKKNCMSCSVCVLKYTTTSRQPVTCLKCDYQACAKCTQKYVLERLAVCDPHLQCMNCHHIKPLDWLYSIASKTWIENSYASARKEMLWKLEQQTLINDSQRFLQQNKSINDLGERIVGMDLLIAQIHRVQRERANLQALRQTMLRAEARGDVVPVSEDNYTLLPQHALRVKQVLGRCPGKQCLGLLEVRDGERAQCSLCQVQICTNCMEHVDSLSPVHMCTAENIESTASVLEGSRLCPGCYTRIYRISGCAKMFCTKCGTGFDWSTGWTYGPGEGHNPHQHEYAEDLKTGKIKALTDEQLPCVNGLSASDAKLWKSILTERGVFLSEFSSTTVMKELLFMQTHVLLHNGVKFALESLEFVNEYGQKQRRLRMRFALLHGSKIDLAQPGQSIQSGVGQSNRDRAIDTFKNDLLRLEHKHRVRCPCTILWTLFQSEVVRILLALHRSASKFREDLGKAFGHTQSSKWFKATDVKALIKELEHLDQMTNESLASYAQQYQTSQKCRVDTTLGRLVYEPTTETISKKRTASETGLFDSQPPTKKRA